MTSTPELIDVATAEALVRAAPLLSADVIFATLPDGTSDAIKGADLWEYVCDERPNWQPHVVFVSVTSLEAMELIRRAFRIAEGEPPLPSSVEQPERGPPSTGPSFANLLAFPKRLV